MVQFFHDQLGDDQHDKFQKWRAENSRGFVINRKTVTAGMVHRADCRHMGDFTWEADESLGLTVTEKICSADRDELSQWANNESVNLTICNDCMGD